MFRIIPLSIIRNLFTLHSAIVYIIQVCRQLSNRTRNEFYPDPAQKIQIYFIAKFPKKSRIYFKEIRPLEEESELTMQTSLEKSG